MNPQEKEKSDSLLQRVRIKSGLSQRHLAEKSGISRGRLRKLEGRNFEEITLRELGKISEALGKDLKELIERNRDFPRGASVGRAGEVPFELNVANAGCRIASLTFPRAGFFIGKLFLGGRKVLGGEDAPRATAIFIQVLLGAFKLETGEDLFELKEGDRLLFPGNSSYVIRNPFTRESVGFFITIPAFSIKK